MGDRDRAKCDHCQTTLPLNGHPVENFMYGKRILHRPCFIALWRATNGSRR